MAGAKNRANLKCDSNSAWLWSKRSGRPSAKVTLWCIHKPAKMSKGESVKMNGARSQWFPQSSVTILSETYSQRFPHETCQSDGSESSSIQSFSTRHRHLRVTAVTCTDAPLFFSFKPVWSCAADSVNISACSDVVRGRSNWLLTTQICNFKGPFQSTVRFDFCSLLKH